jgi:hypothetical protein
LGCRRPSIQPRVRLEQLKHLGDAVRTREGERGTEYLIEGDRDELLARAGLAKPVSEAGAHAVIIQANLRDYHEHIAQLKAAHTREIAELKTEIDTVRRNAMDDGARANMIKNQLGVAMQDLNRLKGKLHEATVAKLAERVAANGQTTPTVEDVADAALGRGRKIDRNKLPAFTEAEYNRVTRFCRPEGKPPELQKEATEISALLNDRRGYVIKAAKRNGAKANG